MKEGTVTISIERFKELEEAEIIANNTKEVNYLDNLISSKQRQVIEMEGKIKCLTINKHKRAFSCILEVSTQAIISNDDAINKVVKKCKDDLKKMSLFSIWKWARSNK